MRQLLLTSIFSLCFVPWLSAQEPPAPPAQGLLLDQLVPMYQLVKTDPNIQKIIKNLEERQSRKSEDELLKTLPLSPLELLRVDMHLRRYEVCIPAPIQSFHKRWVVLNSKRARSYYGDLYVDELLGDGNLPEAAEPSTSQREPNVGVNRNPATGSIPAPEGYQGEIQIAVNPQNPNQIVAASNTADMAHLTQAIFFSSNGGETWSYTSAPAEDAFNWTCNAILSPIVYGSDPAVWWNDQGQVFLEYMMVCTSAILPLSTDLSIVVTKSIDGGQTWLPQGVPVDGWGDGTIEDKNFYGLDRTPESPFYQRHYTCWDRDNNEKFAWSANSGVTWNEVDLPAAPSGGTDLGCEIAVQKDGMVHVIFDSLTCSGSSCTNEQMFYTHSTDGGVTWSAPVMIRDFNLTSFSNDNKPGAQDNRGINPFGSIDVDNSGGTFDGKLYVTFSDYETGTSENGDIWISSSTNNGATWSAAVRVNDDGAGGALQFHPFLMVDQSTGIVYVSWHDARNDPNNHEVEYFLARSVDGGLTFEPNIQVSQASPEFNNDSISYTNANTTDNPGRNPNQFGEYMGLDVINQTAYLAWMDTRHYFPNNTSNSQKENLGFAKVTFEDACQIVLDAPGSFCGARGGPGTIQVTTESGCSWDAQTDALWIQVLAGFSGSGNDVVHYITQPNTTGTMRQGVINIDENQYVVEQSTSLFPDGWLDQVHNWPAPQSVIDLLNFMVSCNP